MANKTSKALSLTDALAALGTTDMPGDAVLRALSDLDGEKLRTWRDVWNGLPTRRRLALAERLRDLAEEDIEVEFQPLFRHGLNDADAGVRLTSVEGLHEDELPSLIDPLIALVRDDPSEQVRAAAAESLGRFVQAGELGKISQPRRDQVYTALMRALLLTAPTPASLVHRRALESLGYVNNEEMDLQLRDAFNADNDQLHLSAIVAMGHSHNRAYRDLLLGELRSLSPAVRREAASAIGTLEVEEAVPELALLLEDPSLDVRFAALDALAEIGGKEARELVEAASGSDEEEFAEHAALALEELDFWHGDIDFSLALFDEDEQKPTKIVKPKTVGNGNAADTPDSSGLK